MRTEAKVGYRSRISQSCGRIRMNGRLPRLGLLAAASWLAFAPASAQTVEQFYRGKTMTIMLGHPPGGSYDLYARLAANHIKRFIPGNPNIIVQHRPGGGGVAAVLTFY